MRCVRILFALLVLMQVSADAYKPYVEPEVRELPGARAAAHFWYYHTGEKRKTFSKPADARLRAAYIRTQVRIQKKYGLVYRVPRLRQTKPDLVLILGPGIQFVIATCYIGPRIILVNSWWADQMNDRELEMLLAHELIHAADSQNERRGNDYLNIFSAEDDDEIVANVLASLMFEPGEYMAFRVKFQGSRER